MSYVYGKWFLSKDLPEKKQFPQKNQYFFKIGMFFFLLGEDVILNMSRENADPREPTLFL